MLGIMAAVLVTKKEGVYMIPLKLIQRIPDLPNPGDYITSGMNWFIPGIGPFDGFGYLRDLALTWSFNNALSAWSEALSQAIYFFSDFINNIFVEIVRWNDTWAGDIANYTTMLACLLIMVLTLKQFFTVYVLESEGDPDADPLDVLVRAAEAIAFACSGTAIFNLMMDLSQALSEEFLFSAIPDGAQISDALNALHRMVTTAPGLILVVVLVIGLILFFITAGIRGAELILMKALFPLFAADKVTTNRERWNGFFTSYMITWVSFILQLFSFQMFAYALFTMATKDGIVQFTQTSFICLGWMVAMIRAPRWLQRYCYGSGVSGGVSRVARTSLSIIPGLGGR